MKARKTHRRTGCWAACWALGLMLASCGGETTASVENEGEVKTALPQENTTVEVATLQRKAFEMDLVSNGKVMACRQADLRFRVATEPIAKVYVKNGQRVQKGQKLAELNLFTLNHKLQQAEYALRQSELEMQDVLIGQGYDLDRMTEVPEEVRKLAEVKSGYGQNKGNYEMARYEVEQAVITAPFDGVVANLTDKEFNLPDTSKPFCRIIASAGMEVAFSVLESELALIKPGDRVSVAPYASAAALCSGTVSEINPLVDKNGLVQVKALCNQAASLFDGMNVRVSVQRSVPDQLVVPKTAVVLRTGKQVLFSLKEGKAIWHYVQTGLENLTEYTITGEDMQEGMPIIVSGNMNLAHESPVVLKK